MRKSILAIVLAGSSLMSRELPQRSAEVAGGRPASASKDYLPGPYRAEILRIIDGDTIEARVSIWLGQEVTTRIRLAGIDAPEFSGACPAERELAARARDALAALMSGGGGQITDVRPDKFGGRVVAKLWTREGRDAGEALLQAGHAEVYQGRRRRAWCPV